MPSECRSPHRSSSASCFLFSPKAFCSIIRLKAFNPQACVTVIMARVWLGFNLLFCFLMSTIGLDVNLIQVPTTDGVSGVFLVQTKTSQYSFNATTAKEACEFIQMRIATKAEVETANKNGLQTCRFGWIEEQIAVIPRVDRNENCGKNKVGVSVWRADISKKFDVFCFKDTPTVLQNTTANRQSVRGSKIFVIILFVLMLVMAVAGAAWYLKMWEKRKTVSILEQNEAKAHC
ncbi:hypothetical protein DNTS_002831 [Danionella cerebrum]|uniref:Link domain-containing protein n=1 Tax=Danionella cerebrum TaxID=2873325 RepID=A0A553QF35_9TELE|nr:hypothetical protein DNTS_002831 [Danionella translucida]